MNGKEFYCEFSIPVLHGAPVVWNSIAIAHASTYENLEHEEEEECHSTLKLKMN